MIQPSDVRDLEQEGVMGNINLSQSWSVGVHEAFGNARRDILLEGLRVRLERLEEVVAHLLKERKNQQEETNQ